MSAHDPQSPLQVAIMGAGAIGGTIGAYLIRSGHDITFVDTAEDHVKAIREHGLRIVGPIDEFLIDAPAYLPQDVPNKFDTIFLAVKAHATSQATKALSPFLTDDGVVVSMQNGLNEQVIAQIIGEQRTLGCFINFGADYLEPGVIHYGGRGAFVLGELDGSQTERMTRIHQAVLAFEPNAIITGNIWGFLWSKLAVGSMIFATALTDDGIADCYAMPAYRKTFTSIAREVLRIAQANGISPESFDGFDPSCFLPGVAEDVTEQSLDEMVAFNRRSAKIHSGVWRDLAVRKRRTEGSAQLGPITKKAQELGLEAPMIGRILEMIREVEEGRRTRSTKNLDELESLRTSGAMSADAAPKSSTR